MMTTQASLNRTNAAVGGVAVLLGLAVIAILPAQVAAPTLGAALDLRAAGFFPFLAGVLILCSGIACLLQLRAPLIDEDTDWQTGRPAIAACIAAAFVLVLPVTGTFAAMLPMMFCLSLLFRYPHKRIAVAVATLVPLGIYVLFERILLILFPHGALF